MRDSKENPLWQLSNEDFKIKDIRIIRCFQSLSWEFEQIYLWRCMLCKAFSLKTNRLRCNDGTVTEDRLWASARQGVQTWIASQSQVPLKTMLWVKGNASVSWGRKQAVSSACGEWRKRATGEFTHDHQPAQTRTAVQSKKLMSQHYWLLTCPGHKAEANRKDLCRDTPLEKAWTLSLIELYWR